MSRKLPSNQTGYYITQYPAAFDIHQERIRAHELHDSHGGSMERKAWNELLEWTTVTGEEVGEIDKAINEWRHGNLTYEEFKAELKKEVLQCAAMFTAWVEAFEEEL